MGELRNGLERERKALEDRLNKAGLLAAKTASEKANAELLTGYEREGGVGPKSDYVTNILAPRAAEAGRVYAQLAAEHRDAVERIDELRTMLEADAKAKAEEKTLRQLRKTEREARADVEQAEQAHAKLAGLGAAQRTAAQVSRARAAAMAVSAIHAELGEFVDQRAALPQHDGPLEAPETHEARALAFEEAADRARAKVDRLTAVLAEIGAEIRATIERALVHRANAEALEHAEALAAYLPALARYRAAHQAAFGHMPEVPRFREIVDEPTRDGERDHEGSTFGMALQMRAALAADPDAGAPVTGLKMLLSAFS